MRKIQKNLIFIIILGIVCASFLVGGISVLSFNRVSVNDNVQILSGVSRENVDSMNERYLQIENLVNTMSAYFLKELDSVDRLKNEGYLEVYTEDMQELAYSIIENNDNIIAAYFRYNPKLTNPTAGFFISRDMDSNELQFLPPTNLYAYDSSDMEHVGWYYLPVEKGEAVWTRPYQNANNNIDMVSYVKPLYVKNQLIGVVGLDLDFQKICEAISGIHTYDSGYAILMDEEGEILYSGEHSPAIPEKTVNEIVRKDDELLLSSFVEKQRLYDTSSMKMRNGQYLVIIVPDEELNKERNKMIFTIILITVAVSTVIILVIKGLLKRIFKMSQTDVLTKAGNRAAYLEKVSDLEHSIYRNGSATFSVIVFDINGLKNINDNLGHVAGDRLIVDGYGAIKKVFGRNSIYRIGGDEFVVIAEHSVPSFVELKVEEFREAMAEKSKNFKNHPDEVVVSCGVASYDRAQDMGYEDTFRRADQEMYKDKEKFYQANSMAERKKV